MKVILSIIFVVAVFLAILALCVFLIINSGEKDYYPDIKDL